MKPRLATVAARTYFNEKNVIVMVFIQPRRF